MVKVLREKRSADILRPMVMEKMDKFIAMEKHCNEYDIHCYSEKRREKIRKHFNNMQHEVTVDLHALPVDCDEASLEVYNLLLDAHIEELSVYDDFLNRLDTYKQFVSSILNGVMIIPSIHGVRAESIVEERYYFFPIAKNIDLKRLSSGERHMVVLAGLLLFYKSDFCHRCDESLVLMDEPEISLHPAWQEALAYFCWKVKSQYNKDFVFATHSPVFVNGYSDRMIDLRDAEVKGD
ncbi:AAA family ATPase [Fibrobacter sp. UWEL]|uniref:AAA family ATPase n=1 Tax=Fibrobacter sp. UWEL TaxID=1896209 RepID=UPI000922E85C|nr:AAA family ATPase [Fibrobacter sp. UWEL]SHL55845.1 AAA domain-containing protein, putative AbiEii toxin, Type IV TA system [Fibrobacter sp. UWEL]